MPNSAGPSSIITYAANTYQTGFLNEHKYGLQKRASVYFSKMPIGSWPNRRSVVAYMKVTASTSSTFLPPPKTTAVHRRWWNIMHKKKRSVSAS